MRAMPPLIVELELWLPPRCEQAPLEGKDVADRCQHETGLAPDVVLGLSFVPDEHDVGALRRAIEQGEVKLEEFRRFCLGRGLPFEAENARSAAEFVAFTQGQPLAWLHLPAESAGLDMAKVLTQWAHKSGYELRDGSSTFELLSDSQVYALWHDAA